MPLNRQLDGGLWGYIWDNYLSKCTWLGVTKNVFFNNYVINKSSGNISYVQVRQKYLQADADVRKCVS